MSPTRKASWYLPIICLVFLPWWVALGRSIFDVGGWLILATLFLIAPVLVIALVILLPVTLLRKDVKAARSLQPIETGLWIALLVSGIVYELTLMDGGDTEESLNSVLTKYGGHGLDTISGVLCTASFWVGAAALIGLFAYNVYRYVHLKYHPATAATPAAGAPQAPAPVPPAAMEAGTDNPTDHTPPNPPQV